MSVEENKLLLRREMDRQGITNPETRAGIAAIVMGESAFSMKPETGYAHTSNQRIRSIFGSRVSSLSDAQLDALKADPRAFFNRVYGGEWGKKNLGNLEPDDGYNFRGYGPIQLTGRHNFDHIGKDIGVDLVGNPEKLLDPYVGCAATVAYIKWRYKGGGWERLKDSVGNNTPDIAATKNAAYARYLASGEFGPASGDAGGSVVDAPKPVDNVTGEKPNVVRAKAIQVLLQPEYKGAIDGILGRGSETAFETVAKLAREEMT